MHNISLCDHITKKYFNLLISRFYGKVIMKSTYFEVNFLNICRSFHLSSIRMLIRGLRETKKNKRNKLTPNQRFELNQCQRKWNELIHTMPYSFMEIWFALEAFNVNFCERAHTWYSFSYYSNDFVMCGGELPIDCIHWHCCVKAMNIYINRILQCIL